MLNSDNKNKLREQILEWNLKYPLDRWYRNKYKIAFNSKEHRKVNILDIRIDYEEELMILEALQAEADKNKYAPGRGQWLDKQITNMKVSEEEAEKLYDNLDLKALDESGDELII